MNPLDAPLAPPADPTLLLTKSELATHFRVSERQIDLMRQEGLIPAPIKVGQMPRWSRSAVVTWIEQRHDLTQPERQFADR